MEFQHPMFTRHGVRNLKEIKRGNQPKKHDQEEPCIDASLEDAGGQDGASGQASKKARQDYSMFKTDVARLQKNLDAFEADLKEHTAQVQLKLACTRSHRAPTSQSHKGSDVFRPQLSVTVSSFVEQTSSPLSTSRLMQTTTGCPPSSRRRARWPMFCPIQQSPEVGVSSRGYGTSVVYKYRPCREDLARVGAHMKCGDVGERETRCGAGRCGV
jgi:hypothetical protein